VGFSFYECALVMTGLCAAALDFAKHTSTHLAGR